MAQQLEAGSRHTVSERRGACHAMWASVAPAWRDRADLIDRRAAPTTEAMIERTSPCPGDRVLELACGPGGAGLAVAARVAPGEVVLSDVAAEMTTIAAARAASAGLGNVVTRVIDLEEIAEPDNSFDVVLCREGLQMAEDPARGAAEIRRVLRPGGRTAVAVWGPRELNPWLGLLFDAVGEGLGQPIPPPGAPSPFALDDPGGLGAAMVGGGLSNVEVEEVTVPFRAGSVDEWWNWTTALAGPVARKIATLPTPAADAIRRRAGGLVAEYETPDGIEIPGLSLVASATT